jgi:hypothetical protein
LPSATSIGGSVFQNCTSLTSIDSPNVTSIGNSAFIGCRVLTSIDLPNVTSIGEKAFENCYLLASIDLPNATTIGNSAFSGCRALASVDLPSATSISSDAFNGCESLTALILRYTIAPCTIDLFALTGTPAIEGMGHIYVPTSLYENYRTVYEPSIDQMMPGFFDILFRKIEDYPEICGAN